MQYFRQAFKQLTTQQVLAKGQMLVKSRSLKAIAVLLMCEEQWLREQAANPQYYAFQAPKANGAFRLIENPHPKLKDAQRLLSDLLQGVYYGIRPRGSYAFIPSTADETAPCNIYTNALRHCQAKWILQLDLKDFFHSISAQRIKELFMALPFEFPEDSALVIARVVTSKNRLPMGAPTSPVLSNLVCFEMDHQLDKLAREHGWTYTRYADDITFSGPKKFSNESMEVIRQQIEGNDFVLNYEKTQQNRIEDEPEICGLAVRSEGKPDLSPQFLKDLKADIKTYKTLTTDKMIANEIFSAEAINRFRQHIEGELSFVRFVKGPNNGLYLKFRYMLADGMIGVE
jgi:RNA-directed DNA polymerase